MNVFTYWEGPKPDYINLCQKTLQKQNGSKLKIITPETVDDWLDPKLLHPNWKLIPEIACKCGALRVALICQHGGFWTDIDSIGVTPFPDPRDFTYTSWSHGRVLNGYFGAPPNHPTTKFWLDLINKLLSDRFMQTKIWWRTLGEIMASTAVVCCGGRHVRRKRFIPIDFHEDPSMFLRPYKRLPITRNTITIGLNNSWLMANAQDELGWSESEMAKSDLLIHKILTYGRNHL